MKIVQYLSRIWTSVLCTCFAVVLLLFGTNAFAQQQPDNKGTEFWLMFPGNFTPATLQLFITSDFTTTGTVDIPGLSFSTDFSVTPGAITTVTLPDTAAVNSSDVVTNQGINVQAAEEITVYGLSLLQFSTDAFLGLPVDILDTEYIALGYENSNVVNGTQFGIVATEEDTTITITPATSAGVRIEGVSYEITLDAGDTYLLRSTGSAPADLTGSTIDSDKPIAFFGGHQCANVPAGFVFCDYLVEQLTPISTWGQSFITFPLETRQNGDTFRILAAESDTDIIIDGTEVGTIGRGEFFETILESASTITTTGPVLVTQYSNGTSFDNVVSDPFQAIVPPAEQFLASYVVSTPATGFIQNFINIIAPDAALGSIVLDGIAIPASDFTSIGSGFSGTAVSVELGSHSLSSPLPFGVLSYGFNTDESYGYPGGLALAEVAELASLILTPETSVATVGFESCVLATTSDQDSEPLVGIRVAFEVIGVNSASGFLFTDSSGEAEFCYVGTNVGFDMITASSGSLTDTVMKQWVNADVARCDIDANDIIDRSDISAIFSARNEPASAGDDPRDEDGDGTITVNDARACVLQCTNDRCVP